MASRFVSQASQDALLKYGPQQGALQQLMREAEEAYKGSVVGGESAARLGVQAVKEGIPQVAGVYNRAEGQNTQVQQQAQAALAALPGIANGYKAASTNAGAAATQRIAGNRASILGQLHLQGVAAANSAASSRQQASGVLSKELGKLFRQSQEVSGQQGAFASSELEKLTHEAEKEARGERVHSEDRAQRERASERSSATSEANSKRSAARSAPGSELPLKEQNKAATTIQQIAHFATRFKDAIGGDRAAIVEKLSQGQPSQTFGTGEKEENGRLVKVHESGEKGEIKAKHPGVPAFKPDVLMSAALDWALGGYLSQGTERRLQAAGYSVKALGVPGAQRRQATQKAGSKVVSGAQKAGSKVVSGLGRALAGH